MVREVQKNPLLLIVKVLREGAPFESRSGGQMCERG